VIDAAITSTAKGEERKGEERKAGKEKCDCAPNSLEELMAVCGIDVMVDNIAFEALMAFRYKQLLELRLVKRKELIDVSGSIFFPFFFLLTVLSFW
jgi:hypothetical protein